MKISEKLKYARTGSGLNQEQVAEKLQVSRQTISNWENGRSYPDIISVIKLSDLYSLSLDELLKGDEEMMTHLNESTDIVSSNKKLMISCIITIILFLLFMIFNSVIATNKYLMAAAMIFAVVSISVLFYQIIRKF